jgi:CheY-specific phosphatase CheX
LDSVAAVVGATGAVAGSLIRCAHDDLAVVAVNLVYDILIQICGQV